MPGGTAADRLVGQTIKDHRLHLGISDVEMMERFWCSRREIVAVESGTLRPNAVLLDAIARSLECEITDFFAGCVPI